MQCIHKLSLYPWTIRRRVHDVTEDTQSVTLMASHRMSTLNDVIIYPSVDPARGVTHICLRGKRHKGHVRTTKTHRVIIVLYTSWWSKFGPKTPAPCTHSTGHNNTDTKLLRLCIYCTPRLNIYIYIDRPPSTSSRSDLAHLSTLITCRPDLESATQQPHGTPRTCRP